MRERATPYNVPWLQVICILHIKWRIHNNKIASLNCDGSYHWCPREWVVRVVWPQRGVENWQNNKCIHGHPQSVHDFLGVALGEHAIWILRHTQCMCRGVHAVYVAYYAAVTLESAWMTKSESIQLSWGEAWQDGLYGRFVSIVKTIVCQYCTVFCMLLITMILDLKI